jgi:hypothetical protein
VGANPVITAFTPGLSTTTDGIIKIAGADYVTFDGIDVAENAYNHTPTDLMEWGYALVKWNTAPPANGCQHVIVRNCTISLSNSNPNSAGLYMGNHSAWSNTSINITNLNDASNDCSFTGNTINSSYTGIMVMGYWGNKLYFDQNNLIGGICPM